MEGIRFNAPRSQGVVQKRIGATIGRMNKALAAKSEESAKEDAKAEEAVKSEEAQKSAEEELSPEEERRKKLSDAQKDQLQKLEEFRSRAEDLKKMAQDAPRQAKLRYLELLTKQVEAMSAVLYTPKSWNKLMQAYAVAKAVSKDSEASMEDINKALATLRRALAQLEFVEQEKEEDEDDKELYDPLPFVKDSQGAKDIFSPGSGAVDVSVAANAAKTSAIVAGASLDVSV